VGAFGGGMLTDKWGAKQVQVASLALAGGGFLLLGQLRAPLLLQVAAFALGAVNESFRPANGAAFAAAAPPERLTQALTLRRLALNLGMTCGPMLGGFLAARDYSWLFVVDGGTSLLAAAVLFTFDRTPGPLRASSTLPAARSPWSDAPFLLLMLFAAGHAAVLYQFFSTYPLALHELHGFPEPQIGSIYAINTLLIVALEMVLVRRLSAAPPLRVAAWGTLLFGGGFALLPLGRGYAFVAATVVVWTFGEMLTMPFLETVAAGRGDERSRGRYLGAYNFAYSVSFAAAPALGAWLYQRFGAVPLFAGIGVFAVTLWLGLRMLSPRFAARRGDAAAERAPAAAVALVPPAS
jgi:MFS family permease